MAILLDQNVDDGVGEVFRHSGHFVSLVRELLGARTPDNLVAFTACDQGLIVVTHDNDYRRFQKLLAVGARNEFALGAGRISLAMTEPRAPILVGKYMRDIEYHYGRAIEDRQRLIIRLTEQYISRHEDAPNMRLRLEPEMNSASASQETEEK